jgi:hypothetical protein
MRRAFILRRKPIPDVTGAYFNGFVFVNPGSGPPRAHWEVKWDDSHAWIIDGEEITQVKKDLWDRLRLAEGIDYEKVQVGP